MSTAFDVRATFLHFIADNIGSIPVNAIRRDVNNPGSDLLKANAVNISFLTLSLDTIATQQVVIDICNDNENTATEWMWTVWTMLRAAFYTTLQDYTVPTTPTSAHTNIMWDRNSVKFRPVSNVNYVHYTCLLPIKFNANLN